MNHPRIRRPPEGPRFTSTACWRGYVGRWAVRQGRFYLLGFEPDGRYQLVGAEPLWADWFTGVIRIPDGAMLQYIHMGYGSIYAREIQIKFEAGIEVKRRIRDNRERQLNREDAGLSDLPGFHNRFEGDDF